LHRQPNNVESQGWFRGEQRLADTGIQTRPLAPLPRKADTAQQVGKTRIASQRVEPGIHPGEVHSIRTGKIALFQPRESPFVVTQYSVYASHVVTTDVSLLRLRLEGG